MAYTLPPDRPALMGILNVTPDSFSDGGLYADRDAAVAHGLSLVEAGADIVDVGGESTRPGADPVPAEDEIARTIPVVEALARAGVTVSIDTQKAEVARSALDAGACIVNDVGGLRRADMQAAIRDWSGSGVSVCAMHMKGTPQTMQSLADYGDVVAEVEAFLLAQAATATELGVPQSRVWIDPGIGFGKTTEHNLALLRATDRLSSHGYPVLVGVSRKSFLGRILGGESTPAPTDRRLEATLAAEMFAVERGARIVRTHDVAATARALKVLRRLLGPG
ncbi:MAG: dihydropteroate synthase [Fimbriimonadaceae bacterium]